MPFGLDACVIYRGARELLLLQYIEWTLYWNFFEFNILQDGASQYGVHSKLWF